MDDSKSVDGLKLNEDDSFNEGEMLNKINKYETDLLNDPNNQLLLHARSEMCETMLQLTNYYIGRLNLTTALELLDRVSIITSSSAFQSKPFDLFFRVKIS